MGKAACACRPCQRDASTKRVLDGQAVSQPALACGVRGGDSAPERITGRQAAADPVPTRAGGRECTTVADAGLGEDTLSEVRVLLVEAVMAMGAVMAVMAVGAVRTTAGLAGQAAKHLHQGSKHLLEWILLAAALPTEAILLQISRPGYCKRSYHHNPGPP
ncbi:hypothetical protein DYH09_25350 [bacterium CPR1]|nr:hypothetical protein [bacterium CPR1]